MRTKLTAAAAILAAAFAAAQQTESAGAVIRAETRLVLVDAVVTDKKGEYVRDLTRKDFKVWEDNQEQEISSFSFEADPALPNRGQKRYLVMFFDNSTMDFAQQAQARQAAARFVDANVGPNRMMAVVEYAGGLRIAQNFTDDGVRLKQVVSGVKLAPQPGNDSGAVPALSRAAAAYGARDVIRAMKNLVRNLSGVPGRKSLVLMTGGFKLNQENISELNELVDACNKANVAVYPIDSRGLVSGGPGVAEVRRASYVPPMAFGFQARTPGAGGTPAPPSSGRGGTTAPSNPGSGGSRTPAPSSPSRGTVGGANGANNSLNNSLNNRLNNPLANPRAILPRFPESASDNQQPLYMLATGTGGFVIVNTNNLLGGLEKIGKEQNEHYLIGYTPEESKDGSCHTLRVKVAKSGMTVRARTGYCNVRATDALGADPVAKDLERLVLGSAAGGVKATMQIPYFYTSPCAVRMNVAMEIPTEAVQFKKVKGGKFHGDVNLLGIAYRADGGVAARFSDTLKFDFENKKTMEAWREAPLLHYEKDVEAAPGKYLLKVAVGTGAGAFAKMETPLYIDEYDGKRFSLSGLALSNRFRKIDANAASLDFALTEDHTPLIVGGMQITPSGTSRFKKGETIAVYAEIYEVSLLSPDPVKGLAAGVQMRVLDRKTGEVKQDSGMLKAAEQLTQGNPVIPLGLRVPIDKLVAGEYNLELIAADTAGGKVTRITPFDIE